MVLWCSELSLCVTVLLLTMLPPAPLRLPLPAGDRFSGLNRGEHEGKPGIWYREWAPAAKVRQPAAPV